MTNATKKPNAATLKVTKSEPYASASGDTICCGGVRGMLKWIEHDEIGHIVVPTSPLRFHGADPVDTQPSPKLAQHNTEIYGGWLGLSAAEIAELEQSGVI